MFLYGGEGRVAGGAVCYVATGRGSWHCRVISGVVEARGSVRCGMMWCGVVLGTDGIMV